MSISKVVLRADWFRGQGLECGGRLSKMFSAADLKSGQSNPDYPCNGSWNGWPVLSLQLARVQAGKVAVVLVCVHVSGRLLNDLDVAVCSGGGCDAFVACDQDGSGQLGQGHRGGVVGGEVVA
jgi:hypothetical protein